VSPGNERVSRKREHSEQRLGEGGQEEDAGGIDAEQPRRDRCEGGLVAPSSRLPSCDGGAVGGLGPSRSSSPPKTTSIRHPSDFSLPLDAAAAAVGRLGSLFRAPNLPEEYGAKPTSSL
jgi:hypothetical protein